jgi:hypothetical protein
MSVFEPWVGKRIGEFSAPKLPNLNRQQFTAEHEESATVRETPTPENTGAPKPMKDQRTIPTPANTGAPMPGTKTSTGKIPVKHTRAYPKMQKKQTAPGTKPKKR